MTVSDVDELLMDECIPFKINYIPLGCLIRAYREYPNSKLLGCGDIAKIVNSKFMLLDARSTFSGKVIYDFIRMCKGPSYITMYYRSDFQFALCAEILQH